MRNPNKKQSTKKIGGLKVGEGSFGSVHILDNELRDDGVTFVMTFAANVNKDAIIIDQFIDKYTDSLVYKKPKRINDTSDIDSNIKLIELDKLENKLNQYTSIYYDDEGPMSHIIVGNDDKVFGQYSVYKRMHGNMFDFNESLSIDNMMKLTDTLFNFLKSLHTKYCHMDLKPENILYKIHDSDILDFCVHDFGLMSAIDEGFEFKGTPIFFSPLVYQYNNISLQGYSAWITAILAKLGIKVLPFGLENMYNNYNILFNINRTNIPLLKQIHDVYAAIYTIYEITLKQNVNSTSILNLLLTPSTWVERGNVQYDKLIHWLNVAFNPRTDQLQIHTPENPAPSKIRISDEDLKIVLENNKEIKNIQKIFNPKIYEEIWKETKDYVLLQNRYLARKREFIPGPKRQGNMRVNVPKNSFMDRMKKLSEGKTNHTSQPLSGMQNPIPQPQYSVQNPKRLIPQPPSMQNPKPLIPQPPQGPRPQTMYRRPISEGPTGQGGKPKSPKIYLTPKKVTRTVKEDDKGKFVSVDNKKVYLKSIRGKYRYV